MPRDVLASRWQPSWDECWSAAEPAQALPGSLTAQTSLEVLTALTVLGHLTPAGLNNQLRQLWQQETMHLWSS